MLVWLVGLDLNRLLMGSYTNVVVPVFGHAGTNSPFVPLFSGSGHMGFGPFALLLVSAGDDSRPVAGAATAQGR
jgi:hypothetical protein